MKTNAVIKNTSIKENNSIIPCWLRSGAILAMIDGVTGTLTKYLYMCKNVDFDKETLVIATSPADTGTTYKFNNFPWWCFAPVGENEPTNKVIENYKEMFKIA